MKKSILFSLLAITISLSNAEYTIKYPLDKDTIKIVNTWQLALPLYSNWVENPIFNCTDWLPLPESVTINTNFNQNRNCTFNDSRTVQQREKMGSSYRNVGEPTIENRERNIIETRQSVGLAVNWLSVSPIIIMDWTNDGQSICQYWSPNLADYATNVDVTQTSTNCSQTQNRIIQNREQESTTLEYRNVGSQLTESRTLVNQTKTRVMKGTKVDWIASSPSVIMDWTNNGQATCQTWSPNLADYSTTVDVTQTSNNCSQPQNRIIQNREQESYTLEYRDVGSQITENRILENQTQTRVMKGTKSNKVCMFDESFNPNYFTWFDNNFWLTGYQDIPGLWIDTSTGKHVNIMSTPYYVPGLTKVSNTEFKYSAPSGVWTITRGSLVPSIYGHTYYQVCFQK